MAIMSLYDCAKAILIRYLAHDYEAYNVLYCLLHKHPVSECAWMLGIVHWRVRSLYNKYYQCLNYTEQLETVYDWIAKSEIAPYVDANFEKCKCGAFLYWDRVTAIQHIANTHYIEIHKLLERLLKETNLGRR